MVDMCLADFAANYNYITNKEYGNIKKKNDMPLNEDDEDEDDYDKAFNKQKFANYDTESDSSSSNNESSDSSNDEYCDNDFDNEINKKDQRNKNQPISNLIDIFV